MIKDKNEYRILVIEDNPGDFALVEDFLFEHITAPTILEAKDYQTAAKILSQKDCSIDIILLDLSLPDKTGESLIKEIMDRCHGAPVIVLTGYTDFDFGIKSLEMGVSDYILKDDLTAMALYKSIIYSIKRKENIADLEESEKKYSDLFNLSPLPMWVVDVNTLEFLDVNQATVENYGFTREEFLSMTLRDIRPEEHFENLEIAMASDRLNTDTNLRRVFVHRLKNGTLRHVEIQVSPITYKDRRANIVIATDLTETLNHIKAIEDQNERLREISWIQSHKVRAPLSRMMGLIPLLKDLEETQEDKEKMIDFILLSATELDEVVKIISDKSRVEDFKNLLRQPGQ